MTARHVLAALVVGLGVVVAGACGEGEAPRAPATSTTEKVCTVFDDGSVLCSDGTGRPAP